MVTTCPHDDVIIRRALVLVTYLQQVVLGEISATNRLVLACLALLTACLIPRTVCVDRLSECLVDLSCLDNRLGSERGEESKTQIGYRFCKS